MKKMICKILSAIMILTSVTAISVSADEAVPTTSTVLVNGNNIKFDSYNINGNNYFKLRDLAYVLNTTEKQFSIGYNEVLNTVSLTSRQPYIAVGGEMEIGDGDNVQTEPTSSTILKNGEVVQLQAYLIDDSNYFKLRDIGELLDFSVEWNGEENSISIDTSKSYVSENEGDKVTEDTYYSQYKTGEFVEITGKLVSIEKIKEVISTSDNDVWLGCLKNAENTEWMVCLNVEEYGIGHKSDFDPRRRYCHAGRAPHRRSAARLPSGQAHGVLRHLPRRRCQVPRPEGCTGKAAAERCFPHLASVARYGDLLHRNRACGRLLNYYFNQEGEIITSDRDFAIQIPREVLSRCPRVIGLCSANTAASALEGALNTGLFTALVVREGLAEELLRGRG